MANRDTADYVRLGKDKTRGLQVVWGHEWVKRFRVSGISPRKQNEGKIKLLHDSTPPGLDQKKKKQALGSVLSPSTSFFLFFCSVVFGFIVGFFCPSPAVEEGIDFRQAGTKFVLSRAKVPNPTITSNWFLRPSKPPTINLLVGDPCWRDFHINGQEVEEAPLGNRKSYHETRKSCFCFFFIHLFHCTFPFCSSTTFAQQCCVAVIFLFRLWRITRSLILFHPRVTDSCARSTSSLH